MSIISQEPDSLKEKVFYNRRIWLNDNTSSSTGSVVCFDGVVDSMDGFYRQMYLEIADCRNKIKLHQSYSETNEQFINKLKTLRTEIDSFINHLENNK